MNPLISVREYAQINGHRSPSRAVVVRLRRQLKAVERSRGITLFEVLRRGRKTWERLRVAELESNGLLPSDVDALAKKLFDALESRLAVISERDRETRLMLGAIGARLRKLESLVRG